MHGPIENLIVVGGINGVYFAISFLLGLELTFDVFRLRKTPVTPTMRIGGIAMLVDAISIVVGLFLYSIYPEAVWLDGLSSVLDVIVEIFFIFLGIALLSGRYPNLKQRLSATVPILLSIIVSLIFSQYENIGLLIVDLILLVIFNHIGYQIYKRDKKLEHFYSNMDNLRSSWFLFYMIVIIFEMPLYYFMDILNAWDIRGSMLYNIVMVCLYLYLAQKLSTQENGLTIEEIEGYEKEIEAVKDPIVDPIADPVTPETIAEALTVDAIVEDSSPKVTGEEASEIKEEGKTDEETAVEDVKEEASPTTSLEEKGEDSAEIIEEAKAEENNVEESTEKQDVEEKHADKVDSYLTIGQQKAFAEKLRHLMEDERAYKNPDLTVEDLKSQLRTNAAYFYYFMHDVIKMRFYEYVNTYRVEAAKRLLAEQDYTMEYIALTTGFNSYNSFVRTFKKFTGVTPSKWAAQAA